VKCYQCSKHLCSVFRQFWLRQYHKWACRKYWTMLVEQHWDLLRLRILKSRKFVCWLGLGEIAKNCEKTTINLFMCVCLSVHMEQLGSNWTDFLEIWYLGVFRKSVEKIRVSLQSDKNIDTLHEIYVNVWQHLSEFFLEWEMFRTKPTEKIKTHILCSVTLFRKSCRL